MVVVSFEPKTNFLILCFCFPVAVFFRKCVRIGGGAYELASLPYLQNKKQNQA